MHADHRLHLDDAGGDLDQTQTQSVELGDAPHRTFGHGNAKPPHEPISPGMEKEPELIGRRLGAGCAVGGQVGLEGFDVIFGPAASAVQVFVEPARVAPPEIGGDEAGVGPFRADLDAGDDPLDAAPTFRAVVEFLEPPLFAVLRRGLEARLRAGLEIDDMATQGRGRRDAEDVIDAVRPTPIENLGAAIMAVARNRISVRGQ